LLYPFIKKISPKGTLIEIIRQAGFRKDDIF
jgi:hypothetical protein